MDTKLKSFFVCEKYWESGATDFFDDHDIQYSDMVYVLVDGVGQIMYRVDLQEQDASALKIKNPQLRIDPDDQINT